MKILCYRRVADINTWLKTGSEDAVNTTVSTTLRQLNKHNAKHVDATKLRRIRRRTSLSTHQHFKMASQRHLRRPSGGHATRCEGRIE